MKEFLPYLLQVSIVSGLLYGYYHFALKNNRFHRYNRFYLLAATVLSLTLPFLNIPVYFREPEQGSSLLVQALTVIKSGSLEEAVINETSPIKPGNQLTGLHPEWLFYGLIVFIFFARVLLSLLRIRRIIIHNPVKSLNRIQFVSTNEPAAPFSFFRWMIWNNKIELESIQGKQIFRHELYHIEQKHSLDAIYTEFLTAIFWFNPFFHLIKKELKTIHEFLADQFAIKGEFKWQYAELLLMRALNTQYPLVNPFFQNQIKRRIAMITTSPKPGHQYLRKLLVLPVFAIILGLFAFRYKVRNNDNSTGKNHNPVTVVIDAGHGGKDGGAIATDGTYEKDITLAIAKKIRALNEDENLKVLLTRESDVLPELKTRSEFSNQQNPSLFLSIHVNASKDINKNGVEVVIPNKNKNFENENKILASALLGSIGKSYPADQLIRRHAQTLWVLENSNCPAALIQYGYLTNNKDLKFVQDPVNQEKIARDILLAISQYLLQPKGSVLVEQIPVVSDTIKPKVTEPNKKVFEKVEIEPSFPGGTEKWNQYLEYALNKSVPAENKAPKGDYTVVIQFTVNLDGTIRDIKPLTRHGFGMEEEAMRVLKMGPKWLPAVQNGIQVVAYKKIVVHFFMKQEAPAVTKNPSFSVSGIKEASVYELLKLDEGTEIVGYMFTTGLPDGTIAESYNTGNKFNESTTKLIGKLTAGDLITFDQIRVIIDGKETKLPGRVYQITN